MDGKRVLITTTAAWQVIVGRLQSDEQRLSVNLGIRFYRESFPEQGKRISIHRDGGESVRFVVLANSKLTGFTAVSYFFTLTRDEPFFSGMKTTPATLSSIIVTLEPLFVALLAWVILGEVLGPVGIAGALILTIAVIVASRYGKSPDTSAEH